jgi:CheY-like chemotaxis protein
MPQMSGDKATRAFKALHPEFFPLGLSASILQGDETNVITAGGDEFSQKTYEDPSLL